MSRLTPRALLLRSAMKELEQARKAVDRARARQVKGTSLDRRELRRIKAQEYRAMVRLEKAVGTYSPLSMKLTPARMTRARKAWAKTEKLLASELLAQRRSKATKRRKRTRKLKHRPRATIKRTARPRRPARPVSRPPRKPRTRAPSRPTYKLKLPPIKRRGPIDDRRMQITLKGLRRGKRVSEIAPEIGVSSRQLSRQLELSPYAVKKRGAWHVRDDWPRQFWIFSAGRSIEIVVPDFETASRVGTYLNAVSKFLESNDPEHLAPFIDQSVTDIEGNVYVFEINPNALYRLRNAGSASYPQIYRLIT